jgi:hypothetical protein
MIIVYYLSWARDYIGIFARRLIAFWHVLMTSLSTGSCSVLIVRL